jgi:hypothetical protein
MVVDPLFRTLTTIGRLLPRVLAKTPFQTHLILLHRTALAAMLAKHDEMFNFVLGKYPDSTVHLQVVPGVSPVHCKPFAVPHCNLKQFKREIGTLVLLDVIEPILISAGWAFPSFLVPNNGGTAQFVSNFRRLNEILRHEKHDLPRIRDVLQGCAGFDFVTTIDITSPLIQSPGSTW